jgi:hypothetical protein
VYITLFREMDIYTEPSELKINLDCSEHISYSVEVKEDRVTAKESISNDVEVYRGEPVLSFRTDGARQKGSLAYLKDIAVTSKTVIASLYKAMSSLYPGNVHLLRQGFLNAYGKLEDGVIDVLLTQPEHIIYVKFHHNHFTSPNGLKHLYLGASKMNHSCNPNCSWNIERGVITIKSIREIAEGEELFISYFPGMDLFSFDTATRRRTLMGGCSFICTCSRCMREQQCGNCSKKQPAILMSCSRCKIECYCSAQCQKLHWSSHRRVCEKVYH